jgi:hypothetical protein
MDALNAIEDVASHTPDQRQKTLILDATQRMNAVRLVDLSYVEMYWKNGKNGQRVVRYGGQGHKHLLLLIDHHIGNKDGWSLTYGLLAVEMTVSESTVYRLAGDLDRASLIRRQPEQAGFVRFSICWSNLFDLTSQQDIDLRGSTNVIRTTTKTVRATANKIRGSTNKIRGSTKTIRGSTKTIRGSTKTIRGTTNAPLIPLNTPPSPPSEATFEQPTKEAVEMVMMMLKDCGVELYGPAVEIALSNNMTLGNIRDVVAHYRDNAGRWNPQILYTRLVTPGNHLRTPHEGWFGDAGRSSVTQAGKLTDPLETQFGDELDEMTAAEVETLLSRMHHENRGWIAANVSGDPRRNRTSRRYLLEVMNALSKQQSGVSSTHQIGVAS